MRALLNGVEGNNINLQKGESASIKMMLLADDGSIINLTGDTVTLALYDRADRLNAATVTATATLTTPTAGFTTVSLTVANINALTAGTVYYASAKRDVAGGGTSVDVADKLSTIQVG